MKVEHRQPRYLHPIEAIGGMLTAQQYMKIMGYPPVTDRWASYQLARFLAPVGWNALTPRERIYFRAWTKRLMNEINAQRSEPVTQQ